MFKGFSFNVNSKKEQTIQLEDITIKVVRKDIKNMYLSIRPPNGEVKISAPAYMSIASIKEFAFSKLHWIQTKQQRFLNAEINAPYKYVDGEVHYFLGNKYLLNVIPNGKKNRVVLSNDVLELNHKLGASDSVKAQIMNKWYREQLQMKIPDMIRKWEEIIGVKSNEVRIKQMKTKWGTCNIHAKRIWLNLELIKKPERCIEYVVAHELIHLIEPSHNYRFKALMDKFMPNWRVYKKELNQFAVC